MMANRKQVFFYSLFLIFTIILGQAHAQSISTETHANNTDEKTSNTNKQLNELLSTIEEAKQDLEKTKSALIKTTDELDTKSLTKQRDQMSNRLQGLEKNFESIATGGIDLDSFEKDKEPKKFDWQEETKEIFRPMLDELKRLTERPRTIERLRTEKTFLESRLPVANNGLETIRHFKANTNNQSLINYLSSYEEKWLKRHNDISSQLNLVNFQLEELLNPSDKEKTSVTEQIKSFFSGRGLNIIYGIMAFFLVYSFFKLISRLLIRSIDKKQSTSTRYLGKTLHIAVRLLSIVLSVLAVVIVFYVQGDWILLGISLLFILGFAWTLRQSLPGYVTEAKLLLNLGPVRENERVLYNGIPWQVMSLNFYSTLNNPALSGGTIKLPTHIILELNSRPVIKDEPWFPCDAGEHVALDDDHIGPVLMQTPDVVTVRVKGGSTKTYTTCDFLALNPVNLSHGFGIFVTFGLDYQDQANITSAIPDQLKSFLQNAIEYKPYGPFVRHLNVEFKQASASSLDLMIISTYDGEAAEYYFNIRRFLQSACVDACNHYGWNIPFDQLTIHSANPNN